MRLPTLIVRLDSYPLEKLDMTAHVIGEARMYIHTHTLIQPRTRTGNRTISIEKRRMMVRNAFQELLSRRICLRQHR